VEGIENVREATEDDVIGGTVGHFDFAGEPRKGIDATDGACFPDPDFVASVGSECGADIPSVEAMSGPGLAFGGFLMGDTTRQPGGPNGVRLKSNVPWTWAHADNFGLMREPRSRFSVISAFGRSWSQR
jgi:hypothetical protein